MRIPSRVYANPDLAARPERLTKGDPAQTNPTAPARRVGVGGVKVTVSARARALAEENAIDEEKVQRLRSAIAGGALAMNFQLIANRLVETGG